MDTEGGFSVERVKQLCETVQNGSGEVDYKKVLGNIFLLKPTNFDEQKKAFEELLKYLKQMLSLASKTKGIKTKEFLEDLYWSRYEYCIDETDDNWEISLPVRSVFFEFQKKQPLEKLIKAVEAVERKIKKSNS